MAERPGKDLLLKYAQTLEIDVSVGTADTPTNLLATAHGKAVGDIVVFTTVPGSITEVTANVPYYVKEVTANNFKISATPAGSAISFASAITDLSILVYSTVAGLRTHSLSFASEAIDGTNYGSNQWNKIIDGAGIRQMSVSGDGVFTDDNGFESLQDAALANTNVKLAWVDVSAGIVFLGTYKVTSLELAGAYDAEGTFSLSAESSEAVTVRRAA